MFGQEKRDDQLVLVNCVWPLAEKPLDQPVLVIYVWLPVSKQMQKRATLLVQLDSVWLGQTFCVGVGKISPPSFWLLPNTKNPNTFDVEVILNN
jgi:hypothetical protein